MLNTKMNLHTLTDITLSRHQLWKLDGDRRGDVISCSNGSLWITQEGDLKDHVVESGEMFWVTRPGTVVVQALKDAQFKYSLNELDSRVENDRQPFRRSTRIHSHHQG